MLTDQLQKKGGSFPTVAEWRNVNHFFFFSKVFKIVKAEVALEFLFYLSYLTIALKTSLNKLVSLCDRFEMKWKDVSVIVYYREVYYSLKLNILQKIRIQRIYSMKLVEQAMYPYYSLIVYNVH